MKRIRKQQPESIQYIMVHPINGARIQCTKKFLLQWLARGFEVEEITNNTKGESR